MLVLLAGDKVVGGATALAATAAFAATAPRHEHDEEDDGEYGEYHATDDDEGVVVKRDLVGEWVV